MDNSTIKNNKGLSNGGGLYIAGANTIITNSNITGNTAASSGGGFYADAG